MPLPQLQPTTLAPAHYTVRAQRLTMLKRIDCVVVRESIKRGTTRFYAVDIYMRLSQSHIPTRASHVLRGHPRREPDLRTERTFTEFVQLLSQSYYLSRAGHGLVPCGFCSGFVDYVLVGKTRPSVFHKWFAKESSVCDMLTLFLNEMLRLARRVKTYEDQCKCTGQERIPLMVQEFLMPSNNEVSEEGQHIV